MNKIKDFKQYINENILFPHGGSIGGEHKKSFSDEEIESGKAKRKGYKSQPKGITHSARMIEDQKRTERKINLMGSELNGYNDRHFVERLIDVVETYVKENRKYWEDNVIAYLKALPKEVVEHFDIDLNADNLVEDFIENKFELFKRSYNMFKEIKNYSVRYGE